MKADFLTLLDQVFLNSRMNFSLPSTRVLLVLLVFFFGCSESKEARLQKFLEQGNDMVAKSNYERAIQFYEAALGVDSCFADAWNNLGTIYFRRKEYPLAIVKYSRAVGCSASYAEAYLNRANAYYESNESYNALKDLERLEKIKPDTLPLHFLRGLILTRIKRYPEAKQSFVRALSIAPENTELKTNIGTVYFFMRDFDSAELWLRQVIAANASEPNAYNTLALIEGEKGNYDEALLLIGKALSQKPSDPYYLNNRGYVFLLKKDYAKALADINESITLDPYNAWAYRNKGILALANNELDDALRLLQQAEKLDPTITNLYYYMGEVYWVKNDKTRACDYYRRSEEAEDPLKPVSKKCN